MAHFDVRMARYSTDAEGFGFERIEKLTKTQANAVFDALVKACQGKSPYLYIAVFRIDNSKAVEGGEAIRMLRFAKDAYVGIEQGFVMTEEEVVHDDVIV